MQVFHILPAIHVAYTASKRPKKRSKETGYKLNRKRQDGKSMLLTEREVMEARWLHEFGGWSIKQVQQRYGFSYHYAHSLLSYTVRSKLRPPRQDDFPTGYQPKTRPPRVFLRPEQPMDYLHPVMREALSGHWPIGSSTEKTLPLAAIEHSTQMHGQATTANETTRQEGESS